MPSSRVLSLVAVITLGGALTACGSSDDAGSTTSGAAAGSTTSGSTSAAAAFPVTIKHAFGETVIESQPERVATVAWANQEVPLALGVVPVGMAKVTWGDDDADGILPWVEEKLTELGGEAPALFDETDGVDFEAVAATEPDVILASYSGLTQEEYDTLSKIAPVVAYPEVAWGTSMDDMITMNSQAIGKAEEGKALIADLDKQIADGAAAHPELAGKKAMFTSIDPKDLSQVGFYTTLDPRAAFLEELGMAVPSVVAEKSASSKLFYETVSAEQADSFSDVDLLVSYGDDTTVKTIQGDALLKQIPAITSGSVAILTNNTPLSAAVNPSPLSVPWGLADYLDLLSAAVAAK